MKQTLLQSEPRSETGFTMIEIMAAAILGLIAIGGLSVMMKAGLESNRIQQAKSQYVTLLKASETWIKTSTAIGWNDIAIGELVESGVLPPSYCSNETSPQENGNGIYTCGGVDVEDEIQNTDQFPPYQQTVGVKGVDSGDRLMIYMRGIPHDHVKAFKQFFGGKYNADVTYQNDNQQLEVTF